MSDIIPALQDHATLLMLLLAQQGLAIGRSRIRAYGRRGVGVAQRRPAALGDPPVGVREQPRRVR